MFKKILIGLLVLGLIAGVGIAAITYFAVDSTLDEIVKEKEPQLRQYIQLDEAAQNQFVLEHGSELMATILKESEPEEKAEIELAQKANQEPEVQKAFIQLGRSLFAKGVLRSETLSKNLPDDTKAKFQAEADKFTDNLKVYGEILEKAKKRILGELIEEAK